MAVEDGNTYAVGGENDDGDASSVECFDPSAGQWSAVAAMDTARGEFAVASITCPE